jgi:hypothetical protein
VDSFEQGNESFEFHEGKQNDHQLHKKDSTPGRQLYMYACMYVRGLC